MQMSWEEMSRARCTQEALDDADVAALLRSAALKPHLAILEGKERVIATDTDLSSAVKFCTALAYEDRSSRYALATVAFYTKILGV